MKEDSFGEDSYDELEQRDEVIVEDFESPTISKKSPDQKASFSDILPYDDKDEPVDQYGKKESQLLHWIILFDKKKQIYVSNEFSPKYQTVSPDLTTLISTLLDLKTSLEPNEIFKTNNSINDGWTTVYQKEGLYISGLFGRSVEISERIELLNVRPVMILENKKVNR